MKQTEDCNNQIGGELNIQCTVLKPHKMFVNEIFVL